VRRLLERGDQVMVLSRRPAVARDKLGSACNIVEGDPTQAAAWMDSVAECDAVINLAGENVFARRWNEEFKTTLRESRIKGTDNVVKALARRPAGTDGQPKLLVNASAIGFYGPHGDEEITEDSPAGADFLAQLCIDWEKTARAAEPLGIRVALVRVGVVLDPAAGALAKMRTPFKMFVGGPVGSGKQWVAWIHYEDLVGILLLPLDNPSACGPLNGTAPTPVTNKDFGHALGKALGRPSFMPTPRLALRLMLGEVADVLTTGQRVLPKRAEALGYRFKFPTIDPALQDLLK
jgi:uncharacterized protein (TIGR01777 family)